MGFPAHPWLAVPAAPPWSRPFDRLDPMTQRGNNGQSAVNWGAKLKQGLVCSDAVHAVADKRP